MTIKHHCGGDVIGCRCKEYADLLKAPLTNFPEELLTRSDTPKSSGITLGGNPVCEKCGRWYGLGVEHVCPTDTGDKSLTSLIRTHLPNYVTEGVWDEDPEISTLRTRLKCDGDDCNFYTEDASWYVIMDRHAAHLAEVLIRRGTVEIGLEDR